MAKTSYHMIIDVQTKLLTWGDPFDAKGKDIIVCVTGNPGLVDFYTDFGAALHEKTKMPVCIVGQCGHDVLPHKLSNEFKDREHCYDLLAQLYHKRDVINTVLDQNCKLHLIGHSIGAWMLIDILQTDPYIIKRVKSIHLLFPTVQRMVDTRSGWIVNNIIRHLHHIILFFIFLLSLIPKSVLEYLISIYTKFNSLPPYHSKTIAKFLNPLVIVKVMTLAYEELEEVQKLNVFGIEKIKHLTHVIYGSDDSWVPLCYMDDFQRFLPDIKMKEVNINHAFVLKSSETVAEMVSDNINNITEKEDI